jgi:hypothetical protein
MKRTPKVSTRTGVLTFETKPMPLTRAQSFEKMWTRNQRFPVTHTSIEKAAKGLFVVCWLPKDEHRQKRLMELFEAPRFATMEAEYRTWDWDAAPNLSHAVVTTYTICEKTGEVKGENKYLVTSAGCECGDFKGRCQYVNARCKHMMGFTRYRASVAIATTKPRSIAPKLTPNFAM